MYLSVCVSMQREGEIERQRNCKELVYMIVGTDEVGLNSIEQKFKKKRLSRLKLLCVLAEDSGKEDPGKGKQILDQ